LERKLSEQDRFDGRAAVEMNDRGRIADAVEYAAGAVDQDVGVARQRVR
jgi:hypothetical protein